MTWSEKEKQELKEKVNGISEDDFKHRALARKAVPIYSGVVSYFPDAFEEIARCSLRGNNQHNPGKELHWDRSKSGDELDALMRHLTDHARGQITDDDNIWHLTKVAWRALAALQKQCEDTRG